MRQDDQCGQRRFTATALALWSVASLAAAIGCSSRRQDAPRGDEGDASEPSRGDRADAASADDSPDDGRESGRDGDATTNPDDGSLRSDVEQDSAVSAEGAVTAMPDASVGAADGGDASADDCAAACDDGSARQQPSCDGLPPICGASAHDDCCASTVVPAGVFNRDNDATHPATISAFRLDTYEITVGRFRKFLSAFRLGWRPLPGSGKNPNDPLDRGWSPVFVTGLIPLGSHDGPYCVDGMTWTPSPVDIAGEARPENCIGWETAFAFCIWDGGRLPTDAEWNYAAAGGGDSSGQRSYPWSDPPASLLIDASFANYRDGTRTCNNDASCLSVVGASPKGNGRWGHADLAGNVSEWVLDSQDPYPATCVDCSSPGSSRVARGGSFFQKAAALRTSARYFPNASGGRNFIGARCVRSR